MNYLDTPVLRKVDPMRRRRAEWMTRADDEILEWLEEYGAGTPKAIADDIKKHPNYVGERCRKLVDLGLLDKPSTGYYRINDDGLKYLAGERDASELED